MKITKRWLQKYEKVKHLLISPINYDTLFKSSNIDGKNLFVLNMGKVNFVENKILVQDPLVFLSKDKEPYIVDIPIGEYDINTLVIELEKDNYRYAATRIKFNENIPTIYHQALVGDENLENVDSDSIFGFMVDAGLATIVDTKTRDVYCDFVDEWYRKNDGKNIYDDFFAKEFKKSYLQNPKFQREDGDWINFKIPNTKYFVPMIQSGFGDGIYPVYFGYDENKNLCDVVIEYIFLGE